MQERGAATAGTHPAVGTGKKPEGWRGVLRTQALTSAMRKRKAGIPTYSVPEAAALLSISQEYLYRLIRLGEFPAVRLGVEGGQGRYLVPAGVVERLLEAATDGTDAAGGAR